MLHPRATIPALLIGGLIVIEVLAGSTTPSAQSQHGLSSSETNLIMSILRGEYKQPDQSALPASETPFLNLELPNLTPLTTQTSQVLGVAVGSALPTGGYGSTDSSTALSDVLPPNGTPLFYAYQDGGQAWYTKGQNVLVIFPNETIQSFNTKTGQSTSWLQDRLALPPVTESGAYQNYQTQYRATIVAETNTWVLMEFPSGGVVKVAKPTVMNMQPFGGSTIIGLPEILSGYEN